MRKHLWFLTILLAIAQQAWAWEGSGTSADPYLIKTRTRRTYQPAGSCIS